MAKFTQLRKDQQQLIEALVGYGVTHGAKAREIQAAIETAAVENNYSNAAGPGPAAGWRQEEPSYGSVQQRLDLNRSIPAFYSEIKSVYAQHPNLDPGVAAQAVQRSAFPKRYGEHSAEAAGILTELHLHTGESLQAGEVPVIGGAVKGAEEAAGSVAGAASSAASAVAVLVDPNTWLRVAEGVGGMVLLAMGLKTLTRGNPGGPLSELGRQAGAAKGVAKRGAELAGAGAVLA